jgi:uncharacterized membrane protein
LTIHRILGVLALTMALSVMLSSAMAHSSDERGSREPAATSASELPATVELHDDAGSPPHDHGDVAPHEQSARSAPDHHDTDMATPAAADHHAGEAGDAVADHHGPGAEPGGHAHWGDNGPRTELERTIAKTGALHSVAVHFPIALILVAALAQALSLVIGRTGYADIVRFLVWTAAFGGLAAGVLGWAHAGPVASTEDGIMSIHRWLGTSLTVGLFAVAGAVEWHRRDANDTSFWTMNVLVFGAALAVGINGFLGGSLAHGGLAHLMGG